MSAHNLFRLQASIYNTPHLITPASFQVILDFFSKRNSSNFIMKSMMTPGKKFDPTDDENDSSILPDDDENQEPEIDEDDVARLEAGVGFVYVDGSLTYKPISTMCGNVGTSYMELVEAFEELAENGVKTVVMEVSSGGGQAGHCFETADQIRKICDDAGITLLGYADECACSAAYALLCVCDVVIANPSADVGSIGVLIALMDDSKAMEQEGLKPIYIYAGENKIPYMDDGSFKKSFLDKLQADVDRLNTQFVAHVSKYTGLSEAAILDFQADSFDAQTALSKGLVNAVMTTSEFSAYVDKVHSQGQV